MEIDIIYTFEESDQEFRTVSITPDQLENEETLKEYVTDLITPKEKEELIKVSTCLILKEDEHFEIPQWFIDAWGKLWFKE
jgi:hypothetical protein